MGDNGLILRLPDALIDQIAAGEVVERPASVVKELVENALDAGGRRIRVEVRDGGAAWIAVTDDGQGMSPRDARLALERHATSKLRTADDLQRIASFGFRGEALPSIASVSRLRLRTRPPEAASGFELRVEAGRVLDEREIGCPAGTRVEVADLFAAVPARRKFLKRPTTEWGHIADWLARLGLALPHVHFEAERDGRGAWVWPATGDPRDRIAAVLAEDEAAALLELEGEEGGAHLHAFVSPPDRTRPNAGGLYLFVNGRPVRDRLLRHALLETYRDWLPRGRFPTAILFLALPADRVDVNVHPAKWEVRFADPQAVHQLVRRSVRGAIERRPWLAGAQPGAPEAASRRAAPYLPHPSGRAPEAQGGQLAEAPASDWIFARGAAPAAESAGTTPLRFGSLRLLGQLLASYLLVEGKDGLLLVDQHAAHERVLYERLRAEWLARGVERQGLLAPASVELEPDAVAALVDAGALALRLGFEIEAFGEATVAVRSLPALLSGRDPAPLVRNLARELAGAESRAGDAPADTRLLEAADRIFATLSCHSARRAGDHLEPREQQAILDALDGVPWAPTCPHGRPVAVRFDLAEIERRFGRR